MLKSLYEKILIIHIYELDFKNTFGYPILPCVQLKYKVILLNNNFLVFINIYIYISLHAEKQLFYKKCFDTLPQQILIFVSYFNKF